jgi:hypothetical protein
LWPFLLRLPLVGLCGCSFMFVRGAPKHHAQLSSFDCTSSQAAPAVDTVVAVVEAVRTALAFAAEQSDYRDSPLSQDGDIALGVGLTALFGAAAAHGFSKATHCSEAKAALAARTQRNADSQKLLLAPAITPVCSYDAQCKGDRVCEGGRCTAPAPPAVSTPPVPPQPPPEAPEAETGPPAETAPLQPAPEAH